MKTPLVAKGPPALQTQQLAPLHRPARGALAAIGVVAAAAVIAAGSWILLDSPFGSEADLVSGVSAAAITIAVAVLLWMLWGPRRPATVPPSVLTRPMALTAPREAIAPSSTAPLPLATPAPSGVLATELAHRAGARLSNLAMPLVGLTEMALSTIDQDHPSRPDIEEVGRCGLQVALIAQTLEFFGGVRHLRMENMTLDGLWKAMEGELRLLLRASTVLRVEPQQTATQIRVDLELSRMILLLLVRNAEDAMQPGGTITVRLNGDTVTVRDHGQGIPDKVRATLYQPLSSGRDPEEGIGLGLHVARLAALTQTSELRLERSGSDGTEFSVRFPRPQPQG